ncbi:unnamed protein product, partial [Heterotrigona itama]
MENVEAMEGTEIRDPRCDSQILRYILEISRKSKIIPSSRSGILHAFVAEGNFEHSNARHPKSSELKMLTNCNIVARSSANTSATTSETPGGLWECSKCLDEMRLMQRLAVSGLLSVILIVLLTGTFVTRRDLANAVERGVAPEERNEQQVNPAWVQSNVVPGQDEPKPEDKDRRVDFKHRQAEPSAVGPPPVPVPGPYVIKPPNPPLDDVTNQRREKIKE